MSSYLKIEDSTHSTVEHLVKEDPLDDCKTTDNIMTHISQKSTLILSDQKSSGLFGSVVSLVSAGMGSGWLSLPKAFSIYGLVSGSFLMLCAGFHAIIAIKLFSYLMTKHKECKFYSDLVETTIGKPWKIFVDYVYLLNLFGTLIAYGLVTNDLALTLLEAPLASLFGYQDNANFKQVLTLCLFMAVCLLTLPLQLLTSTEKFKSMGFLSVMILLYMTMIVMLQFQDYRTEFNSQIEMVNTSNPLYLIQNIGLFTFSLYLIDTFFMVRNEMPQPTKSNIMKVGTSAVLTMIIPFMIIGIFGYISLGGLQGGIDIFTDRPTTSNSQQDVMMKIAKAFCIFSIVVANSTRVIALKAQVFNMAKKEITWKRNVLFTMILLYIPSLIGFVDPAVNDWISLIGAFCMTTLMIVVPAIMAGKSYWNEGKRKRVYFIGAWAIFFGLLYYVSALLTILKMIGVMKIDAPSVTV